jgi:LysR family transcriptional regulator for bpeEF and oprC
MDKLRAMTFFCRAVESGSFAAAAQALEVVPSALSKAVAALEAELGFPLMHRSTRGFSLTEQGAAYHGQCLQILRQIEEAEQAGRPQRDLRGVLRIGMHPGLRSGTLAQLGTFLQAHPALKVETVITNAPMAVVNDGVDVVLHIGRLADSSLVARHLGSTRMVVCATPGYLARHGAPRHPRELEQHGAVTYARRDEESNTRWAFSRGDETCEVEVHARATTRDGIGLVDAVLGGCGIGRPFEISARPWLRSGALQEVLAAWQGEAQAISAVLPATGRGASAKVRAYLEHAADWLAAPA